MNTDFVFTELIPCSENPVRVTHSAPIVRSSKERNIHVSDGRINRKKAVSKDAQRKRLRRMDSEYRDKERKEDRIRKQGKARKLTDEERNAINNKRRENYAKRKGLSKPGLRRAPKANPVALPIPASDVSSHCVYRTRTFTYLVREN